MADIQFELIDDTTDFHVYEGPLLYKLDSVGRLRTWRMQLTEHGHYRTLAGLEGGKQAVSEWTVPVPASQSTVKDQGEFEVRAKYKHQLDREYHDTRDTVSESKMIEPMLAKTYKEWPGPGYTQPKLDGIRAIATKDGLFSRQGQPITAVPHIEAALQPLFDAEPTLILDGELYNHDFREDFGAISSIVRKKNPTREQLALAATLMQYHVYDLVDTALKFAVRSDRLERLLTREFPNDAVRFVTTVRVERAESADTLYGKFVELGYEGGIYRLNTPYELGRRSKNLLKRKEFITEEFPVLNIEEGSGNWAGAAKRFTLRAKNGEEFGAGVRGSYEAGVKLLSDWDIAPSTRANPTATVRYFMLSPDGIPRFPVVIDYQPNGRVD